MEYALVLYYSRYGQTKQLAYYIARGIEAAASGSIEARIRTVPPVLAANAEAGSVAAKPTETKTTSPQKNASSLTENADPYVTLEDLEHCCALALGSPTRFGNMAAPLKHFLDQTTKLWFNGSLVNKPATVFSGSSSMHGGQETTLISMMLPLLHHGAIIVGTPYTEPALTKTTSGGTPYGVTHVAGANNDQPITEDEKTLAINTGKRLAAIAQALLASRSG